MGSGKFTIDREPDYRKVAKNSVQVDKPCVAELTALMDCMGRANDDVDSTCDRERRALHACTKKLGTVSNRAARNNMYVNLQKLAKSWKRFGW